MHISLLSLFAASPVFNVADAAGSSVIDAANASADAATSAAAADAATLSGSTVSPEIAPRTIKRKLTAAEIAAKRAAKPATSAKPAKAAKPIATATATEATPDARVVAAERIAAERSDIRSLYAAFERSRLSVPVKTLSAFKPQHTTAHPIARQPSVRQAAALAAAFAGAGKKLKTGVTVPRVFDLNGVRVCIENGVLRDAVSSGLCTVSGDTPELELITLIGKADRTIIGLLGQRTIDAAKL